MNLASQTRLQYSLARFGRVSYRENSLDRPEVVDGNVWVRMLNNILSPNLFHWSSVEDAISDKLYNFTSEADGI